MAIQKTTDTIEISKISKVTSSKDATREAALVVIRGRDIGRQYFIENAEVTIGRSSSCAIHIPHDAVSRKHAMISRQADDIRIVDLDSTNGTHVNDEPVQSPRSLFDGDLVKVGRTVFKFLSGGNVESQYHEELYRLSTTDGLTQVCNQRYFLEVLDREVDRALRYNRALSLVIFDIDHFKQVNDKYGHLAGDHVLRELIEGIKGKVRRHDVLARYGGEEFAVILPEIDLAGAKAMAEKLRLLVEEHGFDFDESDVHVTISLGVAALVGIVQDAGSLIREADARLYEAKRLGRNCVCADSPRGSNETIGGD